MQFLAQLFVEMIFFPYLCTPKGTEPFTYKTHIMKTYFRSFLQRLTLAAALLIAVSQPLAFTSCTTQKAGTELVVQAAYPELPAIRQGAVYSPRLENVRRIALEDEKNDAIPAGRYEQVVKHLSQKNVLYQTDPNGADVASIPLIAAMIDRDATYHGSKEFQKVFDQAYKDGLKFTSKLLDIAIENGLYLDGLENAVKGASHIVDKANRKLEKYRDKSQNADASAEDVAGTLGDLVRYSAITTKDRYVKATQALIASLEKAGYEITEVDNRFLNKDGKVDLTLPYRAIHLTVRSGQRLIEIQVHDHSSQSIRESTHETYERMRQLSPDSEEYKQLDRLRQEAWSSYVTPEGIEQIKPYKK